MRIDVNICGTIRTVEYCGAAVEGSSLVVGSLLSSCLITTMTWVLVLDVSVRGDESHGH